MLSTTTTTTTVCALGPKNGLKGKQKCMIASKTVQWGHIIVTWFVWRRETYVLFLLRSSSFI
jgi:hypothetical protein